MILGLAILGGAIFVGLSRSDIRIRPEGEPLLSLETGSGRLQAWDALLPVVEERPITGHGFGTTDEEFAVIDARVPEFRGSHPSNSYLEITFDLGLLGLGLIAVLILRALLSAYRLSLADVLGAALTGSIVAGVIRSIFESGMTSAGGLFALSFWVVLGMVTATRPPSRRSVGRTP
jgi:O-antigen ligase